MRRLLISCLLALGTCALSSWGRAADLPLLRGPETFVPGFAECCSKFAGVYVGGQVGASASSVDFSLATQSVIAQMLQQTALENEAAVSTWQVLNHTDTRGRTYGGFIGYNMGWESVVLGFEINYSRIDSNSTALGTPLSRIVSTSSFNYDVTLNGGAGINVKDIATFRGRAGWEVGNFLPYAMLGVAAARADLFRSGSAFGTQSSFDVPPIVTPFSFTQTQAKNNAFLFGWSVGGGVDVLVLPNAFLRAEFEYLALSPYWGLSPVIISARAGVGYKF